MTDPIYQAVILGGGFAGLFTALHLSHSHYPRPIILIDQNERFCFKPLLYEYFSGEMELDQVVPCYQELLKGSGVIFVQGTVQAIDLPQKRIQLASGCCPLLCITSKPQLNGFKKKYSIVTIQIY